MKSPKKIKRGRRASPIALSKSVNHGRIVAAPDEGLCLDTVRLNRLEQAFREWVERSKRADITCSRQRILVIFLLIRYTGAKLSEVLALNPREDIRPEKSAVFFRGNAAGPEMAPREVQVADQVLREVRDRLRDIREESRDSLQLDPGFVRRKFYERAEACGFSRQSSGPEMIRKARAVELMQGNMPLPAVQMMLGHSTPNLTSAYVSFSEDEIRQVARRFMEKESLRKTSARNSFFGKIQEIRQGDIQSRVVLRTIEGHFIATVITNDSVERLGLQPGGLVTAEVKAPWVILQAAGDEAPACSAENRFKGVLIRISRGGINTECVVRISNTIELCAVVSTEGMKNIPLNEGDDVWALFNGFSVVLHVD
ncbi:MAG: TOBE domain-containing protein [Thermodesulfobacteriota bacterium]